MNIRLSHPTRAWGVVALLSASFGLPIHVAMADILLEDYLKATVPEIDGAFGYSLAMSGETLVVGVPNEDNLGVVDSGAVYVFLRDDGGFWNLQARLENSGGEHSDHFGYAVAIEGDTLVVGVDRYGVGPYLYHGAAFVFTRSGTTWSLVQLLAADNAENADFFGRSIALSGDTMVIGAMEEDGGSAGVDGPSNELLGNAGAAYVFERDELGAWDQTHYLKASNPDQNDRFGGRVAIDGDTIVATAHFEDSATADDPSDDSVENAGAAYVFVRDELSDWSQQAFLKASNADAGDNLGRVALSGDRLVLSAWLEDGDVGMPEVNIQSESGAAYVFERDGSGTWTQQAYIKASPLHPGMRFGSDLALEGSRLLVGAYNRHAGGGGPLRTGAAYLFTHDSGTDAWAQEGPVLASSPDLDDWLGFAVAMSGSHLAAGAIYEDSDGTDPEDDSVANSGAVYVFDAPLPGDNEAPVVTPPADILGHEATGPTTAVALGSASVTDNSGELLTASPDDPGPFALGDTIVTWSATDSAGNTGSASQLVNVVDTTAPVVAAPADVQGYLGNPVVLGTPDVVEAVGVTAVFNDWPGGDFPLGDTTVTWTATDTSGNSGTDTQLVTILEPLDLDIVSFRASGRAKLSRNPLIDFVVKVKNQGNNVTDTAEATLVGTLDGVELYRETLSGLADTPGGPGSSLAFPSYVPPGDLPAGTIDWLLTLDDDDPDADQASNTTKLVP